MNVIRFNEPLLEATTRWPPGNMDAYLADEWEISPLFEHRMAEESERDMVRAAYGNDLFTATPFETFRLSASETSDSHNGTYRARYVVSRADGKLNILAIVDDLFDPEVRPDSFFGRKPMFLLLDIQSEDLQKGEYGYKNMGFGVAGQWLKVTESVRPMLNEMITGLVDVFGGFLVSAMAPTTHIATVEPAQNGKSVAWVRQRTHYTLITHGHPANRREVQSGQRVAGDAKGELHRMAHNRRAHYRILSSDRFRFAKGSRVFVRSAWVGPKEWKDEGGRQIYRILDPVRTENHVVPSHL
jgi:hypothetical protein